MKKILLGLCLSAALLGIVIPEADAQTCSTMTEQETGYAGGDRSTLARLNGVAVDAAQYLRLANRAGNFAPPVSGFNLTSAYWVSFAEADFNLDGVTDLVLGGRGTNFVTGGTTNLAIRLSTGGAGGFAFDPLYYVNYSSSFDTYEIRSLGTGDYDGDGDIDLTAVTWAGRLLLFRNSGLAPYFNTDPIVVDSVISGIGSETTPGAQTGESNIASVDVDGDGDLDLVVGVPAASGSAPRGQVAVYINNGGGSFSWLKPKPKNYNPFGTAATRGVSGIAAADFDGDGDVDLVAGSPNSLELWYYKNDGTGSLTQAKNPINLPASHGSSAFLRAGDFDNDGRLDFVVGTDGAVNGPGGYVYWYKNSGGAAFAAQQISGASSLGTDLDAGAVGDFDGDNDLDVVAASGINDPATCYVIANDGFPGIYVLTGTVYSTNLVGCDFLSTDKGAVVSATIHVDDTVGAGTGVVYYLSNSDDQNGGPRWEGPVTPGVKFIFQDPGDFLRWRADLSTSDPAATPRLTTLTIDYDYLTKREYSRTSTAAISLDLGGDGTIEQVLYSASFEFPKWRGHLRSWDVTTLDLSPNKGSVLKDIVDADALPLVDAGAALASTAASSRSVYTGHDAQADGVMNDRLDFKASQAAALDDYLQLGIGSPEVPVLIDFVLGVGQTGFDRPWKLGDINHSSPKALLPPAETPSMMGPGYDTFKLANAARRKLIFVGANDGMLHAFDAGTLDEAWAFIPNNLLYKLKQMRATDPVCGDYLYHLFFVDGTPAVKDVRFADGTWHTVLVTGQGSGWGKDHNWYYFALDVTDPVNPRPLWELTDPFMGETSSIPAIVKIATPEKWVALFGSGYDSDGDPTVDIGQYFYCVDIETGAVLKSFEIKDKTEPVSPFGIQNTLPGSAATVDIEQDGFADAAYFGDLKGRLWKINLTGDVAGWTPAIIYSDPNRYPIITKPAVYVDAASSNAVHVYVGTGGDDLAPNTVEYSFVALIDSHTGATVEWYLGPDALAGQLGISAQTKKGSFVTGEKIWADPVIANRNIFIATLEGNIESLNPCNSTSGGGKIYARYILGNQVGGTSLMSEAGAPLQYLATEQKVRSAVTLGETQTVTNDGQSQNMRKVFIQSFTQPGGGAGAPPAQVLAQPVTQSGLIIKQWREVYKIYK